MLPQPVWAVTTTQAQGVADLVAETNKYSEL